LSPSLPEVAHTRGAFAHGLPETPEPETSSTSFQSLAAGVALGLLVGLAGAAPAKAISNPTFKDWISIYGATGTQSHLTRAEEHELWERCPPGDAPKVEQLAWRKEFFQKVYQQDAGANYDRKKLGAIKSGTGQWARLKYDLAKPIWDAPVEVGKNTYKDATPIRMAAQKAEFEKDKELVKKIWTNRGSGKDVRPNYNLENYRTVDDSRAPYKVRDSIYR